MRFPQPAMVAGWRMLGLDAVLAQLLGGKVPEVEGDDHVRTGADGCCQYMAILWVRQAQRRYQVFVASHERVSA